VRTKPETTTETGNPPVGGSLLLGIVFLTTFLLCCSRLLFAEAPPATAELWDGVTRAWTFGSAPVDPPPLVWASDDTESRKTLKNTIAPDAKSSTLSFFLPKATARPLNFSLSRHMILRRRNPVVVCCTSGSEHTVYGSYPCVYS
jgi:hypothetical protein